MSVSGNQPVDSLMPARELHEISVTATGPRRVLRAEADGSLTIDAAHLGEQAAFMGANDPIALLRTLPAVSTNNDLQAAMTVRGGSGGSNLYESDGVRIVNPLHLLGLYSAFNPSFYRSFSFAAGRHGATVPSLTGGRISACSGVEPDTLVSGAVSLGLIESHGTVRVPLRKGTSSLAVGARKTYLNLLFPDILKLGASTIGYGFTDINAAFTARLGDDDLLRISVFGNRDAMTLQSDKNGAKDGDFGWRNAAASAEWTGRKLRLSAGFTYFANSFMMDEGGRSLDLPSSLTQATARAVVPLGDFTAESDVSYRHTSGQGRGAGGRALSSVEGNVAASWRRTLSGRLTVDAGLRVALYGCGRFFRIMPLPRLDLSYRLADAISVFASYGRYARFDRLIEESTGGLPADFWTCSTDAALPEDVHGVEAGVSGVIPLTAVRFSAEGYYRRMLHSLEFGGSILDLANPSFDPMGHVIDGSGYAAGFSLTLMRQVGSLRGRIGYNIGVSRLRFERYGSHYVPSAHDRLHDLSATLSWTVFRPLVVTAAFTYATGTPYTQARYGYMIGENLICEYFPHNSSRLPSYKRLDLSATWTIRHGGRFAHKINVSVYNAAACRNILFRYTTYTPSEGIVQRESVMDTVIPSLSYAFEF
ncbi:MAG: TonB-dependent receptor [Muribaculaceae bacterium]|nr:TonB-dependent receptor [Muribaculaceae bacterium]